MKKPKKLYCIRHGESTGNAGPLRQGPKTSLSALGIRQAGQLRDRFKSIPVDTIVASTYTRAAQTAEIINKPLGLEIKWSDLLVERIKPSRTVGMRMDDPQAVAMDDLIVANFHDPSFKMEDGENFWEMKARVIAAMKYIESLPEERILVVTHGIFLRMFLGCTIFGEDLSSQQFWPMYCSLEMGNTSITVFNERPEPSRGWILETWGDVAHLG